MPSAPPKTKPVEDTIAKVNDEIAVGSDLDFQAKWARLEQIIWVLLTLFLALSVSGAFGRGPVARAQSRASDGSLTVSYERIERFSTPSMMTIDFGPDTIRDGKVHLWVSDSVVKPLGNQRVIPQPEESVIDRGGILYTFDAGKPPASAAFSLEPASVGLSRVKMLVPGKSPVEMRIVVLP